MIKVHIGDENGAATLEIEGTAVNIVADYAYIGAKIMQAFEEYGLSYESAAALLCSAFNAALNPPAPVSDAKTDNT